MNYIKDFIYKFTINQTSALFAVAAYTSNLQGTVFFDEYNYVVDDLVDRLENISNPCGSSHCAYSLSPYVGWEICLSDRSGS